MSRLFLPILMYHQVGRPEPGDKPDLFVPPERFREQLAWLAGAGFQAVSPDAAAAALAAGDGAALPPRPVLITFDDADARLWGPALEALAERSWPAAAYFVAGDEAGRPPAARCRELSAAGLVAGAHGLTHRRLTELSEEALRAELAESRAKLELAFGAPVRHLAYPFGAFGRREERAARDAGFLSAVTTRRGNRHRPAEILRLRRVPVKPDADARGLRRRLGLAWHLEHALKELAGLERRGAAS